jgi:ubiquinone/menaquinone biosynthesis C-methylase UbiE
MADDARFYNTQYAAFSTGVQAKIRRDAFDPDIGQNGWLSADEHREMFAWLNLGASSRVLDIACGSGGPSLFMATVTGCTVTGVDVNENGLQAAREMAQEKGLAERATFRLVDASKPLPFEDGSLDAIICIDAINHLADRGAVLADWFRVLAPGGRVVVTNPIVVTGILTNQEIAARSAIGFFLYTPMGTDERLLREAGYRVVDVRDSTERVWKNAFAIRDARERYRDEVVAEEGAETFADKQTFWDLAGRLAHEGRLSRFTYLAEKPN